mgnify:FL=1
MPAACWRACGAQAGAEVLVLEKQVRPWGNTARSGGMIPAAGTRFQRAAGIVETADDFAADIFAKNGHTSDPALTRRLARIAPELVEWLVDEAGVALTFVGDFKYPGHRQFRMHVPPSRTGGALVADLRRAVEARPHIDFVTDAPVTALVADAAGGVTGVVAQRGQTVERVRARKVILACNGFAGNPELVARYCPDIADALYFGGEGNTGEGILWGLELGAALAFMDAYQAHANVAVPHNVLITYAVIMEGGFQVNVNGRRFGDETHGYSEHALAVLAQPGRVAWSVYDERIHQLALQFEDYREAQAAGAILSAATWAELAGQMRVDAAALAETLAAYEAAAAGQPDPFGRTDCVHLRPPFYGVKVTGALFHTQGGLQVDLDGRVLRADGSAIPNLYAGGGVAAGLSGHGPGGYLSGNGLLTALGLGWLAGRHAAEALQREKVSV